MGTERVIIWGKEEAGFTNDELGQAGEWALRHMEYCPRMKCDGITYSIMTNEADDGKYVCIKKYAECRHCKQKHPIEIYFIDAETGKYVRE